jgi:hypothetical protein
MKRAICLISGIVAAGCLGGCQSTMLTDDRIASNTASILGVAPDQLAISNRRSDGATNTYYIAKTRAGREYACTINGGGVLATGLVNPPSCNPVVKQP